MGLINVLDQSVANLIAAGEVVERPSSAVKEMVENSIDAGATSVTTEIKNGGLSFLRITDNGSGMSREDAMMCIRPHATSKIRNASDLASIMTLGFRGEALAAISAVTNMRIMTAKAGETSGITVECDYGHITDVSETGCPAGTTIVCESMFAHTPARLKFIKSARAESAHISDYVSRMIMARPDIKIKLIQSGRTVFHSEGDGELDSAIACVYGNDILPNLREIYYDDGYFNLVGFIGTEQIGRAARTAQSFYVNCRYIRSQKLSYALQRAYDTRLMQGRFPFAVLHIGISPEEIDVNVHPNKLEIRFRHEDRIMGPFVTQCRKALEQTEEDLTLDFNAPEIKKIVYVQNEMPSAAAKDDTMKRVADMAFSQRDESRIELSALPAEAFITKHDAAPVYAVHDKESAKTAHSEDTGERTVSAPTANPIWTEVKKAEETAYIEADEKTTIEPVKHAEENIPQPKAEMPKITPVQQRVDFTQYEIIGQLFSCYWIVQHDDEVIFIDQHAMHERRLYERIIERDIPADSQQLLTPEIIKLTPVEFALLMDNIDRFSEIGFDIEEFGAMSVSVRAVPVIMGKTDIKRFLTDAIALFDAKNKLTTIDMKRGALITRACKSAIKAGERISETEIRALLDQYDKEGVPLTCPHGRPVMARMTKTEFEKLFKRIV